MRNLLALFLFLFLSPSTFPEGKGGGGQREKDGVQEESSPEGSQTQNRNDLESASDAGAKLGDGAAIQGMILGAGFTVAGTKAASAGNPGMAALYYGLAALSFAASQDSSEKADQMRNVNRDIALGPVPSYDPPDYFCGEDEDCRRSFVRLENHRDKLAKGERELCYGKTKKYPCLQFDENKNPVSAILKEGERPVALAKLEKDLKSKKNNHPAVKKVIAQRKKKHKGFFNKLSELEGELEEAFREEERLAKDSDSKGDSSKSTQNLTGNFATRSLTDLGLPKKKDKNKKGSFKDLLAQFRANKKKGFEEGLKNQKSIRLDDNQIGISQDNIFMMVHRRYQERRKKEQFFEKSPS